MPRFSLQANEERYQSLWGLLERNDGASASVWELIQMLATNEKQYLEVVQMSSVTAEDGEVDWKAFFEGSNSYLKQY